MCGRHRNRRQTVRISVAACPAEERSKQLARQPQDKHPDGNDERRTEQHPAHGVDIAFDIGGMSSLGAMSRITATIYPLRSLLFARHAFFENTRTLFFDAVSLG